MSILENALNRDESQLLVTSCQVCCGGSLINLLLGQLSETRSVNRKLMLELHKVTAELKISKLMHELKMKAENAEWDELDSSESVFRNTPLIKSDNHTCLQDCQCVDIRHAQMELQQTKEKLDKTMLENGKLEQNLERLERLVVVLRRKLLESSGSLYSSNDSEGYSTLEFSPSHSAELIKPVSSTSPPTSIISAKNVKTMNDGRSVVLDETKPTRGLNGIWKRGSIHFGPPTEV